MDRISSIPKEKALDDDEKRVAIPIGGQIAMSSANPLNFVWAPTWGTFDGIQGSPAFAPWPHVLSMAERHGCSAG